MSFSASDFQAYLIDAARDARVKGLPRPRGDWSPDHIETAAWCIARTIDERNAMLADLRYIAEFAARATDAAMPADRAMFGEITKRAERMLIQLGERK